MDPSVRAALAGELLAALRAACPGSTAEPRGSPAAGTAERPTLLTAAAAAAGP
ncbi:hypothetical protein OG900_34935 [Streptomyces sp. NBC_00433]